MTVIEFVASICFICKEDLPLVGPNFHQVTHTFQVKILKFHPYVMKALFARVLYSIQHINSDLSGGFI